MLRFFTGGELVRRNITNFLCRSKQISTFRGLASAIRFSLKMRIMKTKKVIIAFVASLGVVWFTNPGSDLAYAAEGLRDQNTAELPVEVTISRFASFTNAQHVANGVALRNRVSGTIHLRGVPAGRTVRAAYLYWNFSDGVATGAAARAALFNGNAVTGTKTADNIDPCWGRTGNHTYRATVTGFIPSANPNQDYEVVTAVSGSTSGANPWLSSPGTILMEGATLVVVFSGPAGTAVVIYDALSGTEFSSSLTLTLTHPFSLSGSGLFTMSGADGQLGSGYDNGSCCETGFFNGTQMSGPTVSDSDWDGSAGLPMTQLWDVHTHIVSFISASSVVRWTSGTDCLVPVVLVLQATTP
jgi:hypothetical protein